MADSLPSYKKLPGGGIGLIQRVALWMAADHLLLVRATSFGENYKRFYFHDIQGVVVRRTAGRLKRFVSFSLGALAITGLAALADSALVVGTAVSCGVIVGLIALYDGIAGPSCLCHIRTSVQVERIESIRRLRVARRVLERIRPAILAAQAAPQAAPERVA